MPEAIKSCPHRVEEEKQTYALTVGFVGELVHLVTNGDNGALSSAIRTGVAHEACHTCFTKRGIQRPDDCPFIGGEPKPLKSLNIIGVTETPSQS